MDITTPIPQSMAGVPAAVLGAARSGVAACRLLHAMGAKVTIIDDYQDEESIRAALDLPSVEVLAGNYSNADIAADTLILSPGIPDSHRLVSYYLERGAEVISEVELASRFTQAPLIAVTGSNGKSTVASLIHRMLAAGGHRSFLGGNIGVPLAANVLEELNLQPARPVHVVEISSFQAEHLDRFQAVAVVFLNLTPDHLDRYPDMESYGRAKLNLLDHVAPTGWIIYNHDDPTFRAALGGLERSIPFAAGHPPGAKFESRNGWIVHDKTRMMPVANLILPGPHNLLNYLAAATTVHLLEVDDRDIVAAIKEFQGLPHRLEQIGVIKGVTYFNDSKATNVASTKVALESFPGPVVLILGGSEKGATDLEQLVPLLQARVKRLITYGQAGLHLVEIFQGVVPLHYEPDFTTAFQQAIAGCEAGDTVLLSPAFASYDQFANYEQRGEAFRLLVENLRVEVADA